MATTMTPPRRRSRYADAQEGRAGASAVRPAHRQAGPQGFVRQTESAHHDEEPRHVRGGSGRGHDHHSGGARHRRRSAARGRLSPSRSRCGCGSRCCSPISPKPWRKAAAKPRPTRCARPRRKPRRAGCLNGSGKTETVAATQLRAGDVVLVEAGRDHPRRRRRDRRHRQRGRIGHHRRERAGDPRIGRRPQRRHRRHQGALRLDQGEDHLQPGRDVPGSHDRPGGRRGAAEDAQRNRPQHRDRRPDAGLPAGGGDAAAFRHLQRRGQRQRQRRPLSRC